MNNHRFKRNLNGSKLSDTLSLLSTIEFVFGYILTVLILLISFISGIIMAGDENSVGGFFILLLVGIIVGSIILFTSYIVSVLLKSLAAITLHTYISALNSEYVAESISRKKAE